MHWRHIFNEVEAPHAAVSPSAAAVRFGGCRFASVPLCLCVLESTKTQRHSELLLVPATIVIVNWDGKHLLEESLPCPD
jgi:hypothetical protein